MVAQRLDAITADLLSGPTIDYQHRREVLATWTHGDGPKHDSCHQQDRLKW